MRSGGVQALRFLHPTLLLSYLPLTGLGHGEGAGAVGGSGQAPALQSAPGEWGVGQHPGSPFPDLWSGAHSAVNSTQLPEPH